MSDGRSRRRRTVVVSDDAVYRRMSSVNFGCKIFCPKICVWKINKMPNFTWHLPEKYFPIFWSGELGWGEKTPPSPRRLRLWCCDVYWSRAGMSSLNVSCGKEETRRRWNERPDDRRRTTDEDFPWRQLLVDRLVSQRTAWPQLQTKYDFTPLYSVFISVDQPIRRAVDSSLQNLFFVWYQAHRFKCRCLM